MSYFPRFTRNRIVNNNKALDWYQRINNDYWHAKRTPMGSSSMLIRIHCMKSLHDIRALLVAKVISVCARNRHLKEFQVFRHTSYSWQKRSNFEATTFNDKYAELYYNSFGFSGRENHIRQGDWAELLLQVCNFIDILLWSL